MAGYAEDCVTSRTTLANKLFFCFNFVDFSPKFPLIHILCFWSAKAALNSTAAVNVIITRQINLTLRQVKLSKNEFNIEGIIFP